MRLRTYLRIYLSTYLRYPTFKKQGVGLDQDIMPGTFRETKKFVRAFVQMACVIAANLEAGKNMIIACQLGISRSPNVTAGFFFLFRGFKQDYIHDWLNSNYRIQGTNKTPHGKHDIVIGLLA